MFNLSIPAMIKMAGKPEKIAKDVLDFMEKSPEQVKAGFDFIAKTYPKSLRKALGGLNKSTRDSLVALLIDPPTT